MRVQLLLIFCCFFAGCAREEMPSQSDAIKAPQDTSSKMESDEINRALLKMEKFAEELKHPVNFHQVPIIVIQNNDNSITSNPAACVALGSTPQFIVVKHKVLDAEFAMGADSPTSTLFRVLLHEEGHCIFGRSHDEAKIGAAHTRIEMQFNHKAIQFQDLDVSIMAHDGLMVPVDLEKYYVAELMGLARAASIADLSSFADLKLVPEEIAAK